MPTPQQPPPAKREKKTVSVIIAYTEYLYSSMQTDIIYIMRNALRKFVLKKKFVCNYQGLRNAEEEVDDASDVLSFNSQTLYCLRLFKYCCIV